MEIKYAFAVQSNHIQFGLDHNNGETKTLSLLDYGKILKDYMVLEVSYAGKCLPSVVEVRILGDNDKDPKDESTQIFNSITLLLNQRVLLFTS